MKLSKITTENQQSEPSLRWLLADSVPRPVVEQLVGNRSLYNAPLSYFILEAIAGSRILTEAEQSSLAAILQAGISRLKAALTPKTSADLDTMLAFMAPDHGGSKAVQELLNQAKQSKTPIIQDEDWWTNLFATLNIGDTHIQSEIRNQVGTEFQQPNKAPEQRAPQRTNQVRDKLNQPSYKDELQKEREKTEKHRQDVMAMLDQARANRKMASAKMADIRSQMGQFPQEEDISNAALNLMLECETVKKHIPAFVKIAIGKFSKVRNIQLTENLFDKIRTMVGNPNYAASQIDSYTTANNNERAAKLAVQVAIGHLRTKFGTALRNAGMMPNDIINAYTSWKQLRTTGTNPDALRQLEDKLKRAFKLFNVNPTAAKEDPLAVPPADQQAQPVQAPQTQPAQQAPVSNANISTDTTAFARDIARRMVTAAVQASSTGQDSVKAAKAVAQQAYRLDPQTATILWKHFQAWWATQA